MNSKKSNWVLVLVIFASPLCFAVGWWFYWPVYEQKQLLASAERELAGNQLNTASLALRKLLSIDPNNVPGLFRYAEVLRRLKRNQEATEVLNRAAHLGLSEKDAIREGALIAAEDQFERVGGTLEQVLQDNPDDVEVLEVMARQLAQRKVYEDAERHYSHLVQLQPQRMDLLFARGSVRRDLLHLDGAAADFQTVAQHDPEDYEAWMSLADCLMNNANIDEAEPLILKCRQLKPDRPEPLVALAICAMHRGKADEAEIYLKQAVDRKANPIPILEQQGTLYLLRKQNNLAIPIFEKLLEIDPNNRAGHFKLAQALAQQGDRQQALVHERRYRELEEEAQKPTAQK